MRVCVKVLKEACERILAAMDEQTEGQIEIDADHYWQIPGDQLYDMSSVPADFDVGQLADDWNEVQVITRDDSCLVSHDLQHLCEILRAIALCIDK